MSGEPKPKTRAQKREDRKEALKAAAADVFATHGYHAAKVSQIVEQVGVAQGTFYLYYESKQQIFGELLSDFLTLVVETVAAWEPGDLDSREVLTRELTRVGLMLTEVVMENQSLAAIFFREALAVAPEFDDMIREFYDTLGAMLTDFNKILCKRGLIQPMNYRVLAYMTIGMVERIIREYVVTGTLEDVPPREIVDHLITHFLAGTTEEVDTASNG